MPRSIAVLASILSFALLAGEASADHRRGHVTNGGGSSVTPALQPAGVGTNFTYYVSPTGNDNNSGRTEQLPFRTLQKAANVVSPGDLVLVMNGEYATNKAPNVTDPTGSDPVLEIRRSGTAARWIGFRAYPGHRPVVYVKNWAGIRVRDAAYIEIAGFTVVGNLQELTYQYAYEQRTNLGNAFTGASGITVQPQLQKGDTQMPHHVVIRNNVISDLPGAGIATAQADYVLIQGNTVTRTSYYSPYGNSGISMWENKNWDTTTGPKMYVLNNTISQVDNLIPFYWGGGKITDGHAIIVDEGNNTQRFPSRSPYAGRTVIQGNTAFDIGNRGAHVFASKNIDIVNNTFYRTSQNPAHADASIGLIYAQNINVSNNRLDYLTFEQFDSTNIVSEGNVLYTGP